MARRSATLRQSGGALILTIPKPYVDELELAADMAVVVALENDRIVVTRQRPGRIGLAARLANCKGGPLSAEEREWIDAPPVGRELI